MPEPTSAEPVALGTPENIRRRFYLRFSVLDQAGVLAQITSIFWKYRISIAAVLQKEAISNQSVSVVTTTHMAMEGDLQAAIEQVDKLEMVTAPTMVIRILKGEG
jgi:homoserine dehydrogenase